MITNRFAMQSPELRRLLGLADYGPTPHEVGPFGMTDMELIAAARQLAERDTHRVSPMWINENSIPF